MSIQDIKCPNCSAVIKFDIASQGMSCEFCLSNISMADYKAYEAAMSMQDGMSDLGTYSGQLLEGATSHVCRSCHGELITDSTTIATSCPYCGNTAIDTKNISNCLRPDCIIPFKISKDDAKKKLLETCSKKPLLPKCFKNAQVLDTVQGVYMPFWLFDCVTVSTASYDAQRIQTWTSGNMQHTKTDKFMAMREGQMMFERVPVEASEKVKKEVMESIEPYDSRDLQPFSMAYLSGYLAEKRENDFEQQKPRIRQRVEASIDGALKSTVNGYSDVQKRSLNVNVPKSRVSYAMYPVWLLNIKWKEKVYNFTMNGQTGKIAGDDLPVDKKKTLLMSIPLLIVGILLTIVGFFAEWDFSTAIMIVGIILLIGYGSMQGSFAGMLRKHKTARLKTGASEYGRGFQLSRQQDIFLGSRTTSVRINNTQRTAIRGAAVIGGGMMAGQMMNNNRNNQNQFGRPPQGNSFNRPPQGNSFNRPPSGGSRPGGGFGGGGGSRPGGGFGGGRRR